MITKWVISTHDTADYWDCNEAFSNVSRSPSFMGSMFFEFCSKLSLNQLTTHPTSGRKAEHLQRSARLSLALSQPPEMRIFYERI